MHSFIRAAHGPKGPPLAAAEFATTAIFQRHRDSRSFSFAHQTHAAVWLVLCLHVCIHGAYMGAAPCVDGTHSHTCLCVPPLPSRPDMQIWQPLTSCNLNDVQGSDRPTT